MKKDKNRNNDLQDTNYIEHWRLSHKNLTQKTGVNSGAPGGLAVPAPLVTSVRLLLNDTIIIWYGNCVGHFYINKYNSNMTSFFYFVDKWAIYRWM